MFNHIFTQYTNVCTKLLVIKIKLSVQDLSYYSCSPIFSETAKQNQILDEKILFKTNEQQYVG